MLITKRAERSLLKTATPFLFYSQTKMIDKDELVKEFFNRMSPERQQKQKELYEHLILRHSGKTISEPYPISHKLYGKSRPEPDTMPWMLPAYMNGLRIINEVINQNTNQMETKELTTINEPSITKEQQEVIEAKRIPWGKLGVNLAKSDLIFQARAQAALALLITPTKMDDYDKALKALKEVKALGVGIKNDRLSLTNPVKDRITELMIPENSFEIPCGKVEQACIALKKADDLRILKENQKLEEVKKCREWLTTTRNNADAAFKNTNIEKVSKAYEHALGKGEVDFEMLPEFITWVLGRRNAVEFDFVYPKNTFSLVTAEQYQAMCVELLTFDSKIYLADYENQLRLKFSDYAVALGNKAQAIANEKKESEAKAAAIEAQKANANVGAKLEAVAITPVIQGTNKALKQSYAINMEENIQNAIAIMTAFTAHLDLCLPELNVSKWFSFTPAQAGTALAKVKTKDDSFSPAGITFKTVDKL